MKESSVFKPDSSVLDSDTRYPLDLCVLESEGGYVGSPSRGSSVWIVVKAVSDLASHDVVLACMDRGPLEPVFLDL